MQIFGKTIFLRNILIKDSKFLVSLRKKKNISKYLNNPPKNIKHQLIWIKKNIKDKTTRDFIIFNKNKEKIGTIALNNIDYEKRKAEWGRWICLGNSLQSVESFLLLSKFSFDHLKLKHIYSLTNFKNVKVINFQIRSGGRYSGFIKNKYLIRGKKTHAVKYIFNKKFYLKLKKKFATIYKH